MVLSHTREDNAYEQAITHPTADCKRLFCNLRHPAQFLALTPKNCRRFWRILRDFYGSARGHTAKGCQPDSWQIKDSLSKPVSVGGHAQTLTMFALLTVGPLFFVRFGVGVGRVALMVAGGAVAAAAALPAAVAADENNCQRQQYEQHQHHKKALQRHTAFPFFALSCFISVFYLQTVYTLRRCFVKRVHNWLPGRA